MKDFDKAYFIHCPINQLDRLENALIKFYQPKYNVTSKTKVTENAKLIVESLFK